MVLSRDKKYMRLALHEAKIALGVDEVPIGAVIVKNNEVIAHAHNLRETLADPTAHAEVLALKIAAQNNNSWRLNGATVYCTLEPCCMCAGAMLNARVQRVVYGAADPKSGACESVVNLFQLHGLNHHVESEGGVLAEEGLKLLRGFFRDKR